MSNKMKAAEDARRIINGLRGLLTLADETAALGSLEQAVVETRARLDGLSAAEAKARETIAGAQAKGDGVVAEARREADAITATARESGAAALKKQRDAAAAELQTRHKELL